MNQEQFFKKYNGGLDYILMVMNYYDIPLKKKNNYRFENTLSPFYPDTKKGFSIYKNRKNNIWYFKDFGTDEWGNEYSGDAFTMCALIHSKDVKKNFGEIINLMDFELSTFPRGNVELRSNDFVDSNEELFSNYELIKVTPFTQTAINEFHLKNRKLDSFSGVHQISGYKILDDNGKVIDTKYYRNYDEDVRIAFCNGSRCKIKRLNPKQYGMLGNRNIPYFFGTSDDASYIDEPIFLTGGERDVLTLFDLNKAACCIQSETANFNRQFAKILYESRFKVIILYDIDEAGKKGAIKINSKYDYEIANLSTIVPNKYKDKVKDISEYRKLGLDENTLLEFLNSFQPKKKIKIEGNIAIAIEEEEDSKDLEVIKLLENLDTNNEEDSTNNTYLGIDDHVFDELPTLLQQICYPITERHERDLLFLASLGVLSNIIPVKGIYDKRTTFPNLFIFITAPASAGKGVMKWAEKLGRPIHQNKKKAYKIELEEYKKLDKEEQKSVSKPVEQSFYIPGNTSISAMINQLSKNNGFGVIIESEADVLNTVMKSDWGNISEIFRKGFEFEPISMLRIDSENTFEINNPQLSVILTGTRNQLIEFIPSPENGLFSRFIFMEFPLIKKWKNVHDNTINFDSYYGSISNELLEYYTKLNGNYLFVVLSKEQKVLFNNRFQKYQKQYDILFGESIIASIRRIGNIHFRICLLLTGIRKMYEMDKIKVNEHIHCSDVDFEIANSLTEFFLNNLKTIFSYLPNTPKVIKILKRKEAILFESLSDKFSFSEFKNVAITLKIAESTAYGYLKRFLKNDLVERFEHGIYLKLKV